MGYAVLLGVLAAHTNERRPVFRECVSFHVAFALAHRTVDTFQCNRHRRIGNPYSTEASVVRVLPLSLEKALHVFAAAQISLPF